MSKAPPPAPPAKPLGLRQQRFVLEYLVDGNATAAARRAGYRVARSKSYGPEILKKPAVKAAIAAERARRAAPMTRESAIAALREIAEANVLDYVRPLADGTLELDLWRLERDRAGAVKALSVVEQTHPGTGVVTRTVGFTLADRSAALMKLLPMLGSPTEAAAEWRGWLRGAEAMTELTPEQYGRFLALWGGMRRGGRAAPINEGLDAFWNQETARGMSEAQASLDAALAARQAELDALAEELDAEWRALSEDRVRLAERSHELMRRQAEAEARTAS